MDRDEVIPAEVFGLLEAQAGTDLYAANVDQVKAHAESTRVCAMAVHKRAAAVSGLLSAVGLSVLLLTVAAVVLAVRTWW